MPTRKQRRRRQKDRRHEYEYVYVDAEGQEVETEEVEPPASRRNGKRQEQPRAQKARPSKPAREVPPPSWTRVGKRALIFFPLIFITFSLVNQGQALPERLLVTLVYTAFFMPFMYLMDRALYRAYLRRTGQDTKPPATKR